MIFISSYGGERNYLVLYIYMKKILTFIILCLTFFWMTFATTNEGYITDENTNITIREIISYPLLFLICWSLMLMLVMTICNFTWLRKNEKYLNLKKKYIYILWLVFWLSVLLRFLVSIIFFLMNLDSLTNLGCGTFWWSCN